MLDIFVKQKDTLWIGSGAGISKFVEENQWYNFDVANSGLGYNYVRALCEDNFGNLWIGERGLSVYKEDGIITNINEAYTQPLNHAFALMQNYPNPFNPRSKIKYQIAKAGQINLSVYDILGRKISELVNEYMSPGTYEIEFNGSDLSSGVYFYRLNVGEYSSTKKFILMK